MKDFRSDNTQGCSSEILEAISRAASGPMTPYGGDEITTRVQKRCREIFETDVEVFPVITGTAGNALSIAAMKPATVICDEDAHIVRDELGAPEFFSGARMVSLAGSDGKLWTAAAPAAALDRGGNAAASDSGGSRHRSPERRCLSITNATEAGTVYTSDEIRALTSSGNYSVHLDGARFANAVASTGSSPADLTWRAGVDILVFGGTKNGLLGGELIVVFRKELATALGPLLHRAGHRPSKMRFLSAQFEAYLTDDLWLRNARHANAMATQLAEGLETIHPVQANIVFTRFTPEVAKTLSEEGFQFLDWPLFGADAVRLVTGFATTASEVSDFASSIAAASGVSGRAK